MIYVHVQIQVRAESVVDFSTATQANAKASRCEPGITRFEVLQQADDSTRFILMEVYRDEAAVRDHKATAHYLTWRDLVAPLMAEPRTSLRYWDVLETTIPE